MTNNFIHDCTKDNLSVPKNSRQMVLQTVYLRWTTFTFNSHFRVLTLHWRSGMTVSINMKISIFLESNPKFGVEKLINIWSTTRLKKPIRTIFLKNPLLIKYQ